MQAADEKFVDLDELGPQFEPAPQTGIAVAVIVEGQCKPHAPAFGEHAGQRRPILDRIAFGQFDDDAARRQSSLQRDIDQIALHVIELQQGRPAEIDEQFAGQTLAAEFADCRFRAHDLEFGLASRRARGGEQRQRIFIRRRRAHESLVPVDLGPIEHDDGLKHHRRIGVDEDAGQLVAHRRNAGPVLRNGAIGHRCHVLVPPVSGLRRQHRRTQMNVW